MKSAALPENEKERLAFLKQLRVLDTPIEERFERITRIVCRSLDVPIAAVSLVDEDRQWFKSIQGLDARETGRDVAFCAHAILDEGPFIVTDAAEDSRFADNPLVRAGPGIRFYAGCPITLGNGFRVGTLCAIDDKPRSISQEDIEILRDLSDMVRSEFEAISLSAANQDLVQDLAEAERAALIDPLSRLWNRTGAMNLLHREWKHAGRDNNPLSLGLIDIDHFKAVNDTHGHDAGDRVIKHVAATVLGALRPYDTVARWGGEEFLMIMPDMSADSLKVTLDRVRAAVEESKAAIGDREIGVTVSIGGVCINRPDDSQPSDYIKIADQEMYRAKQEGRNRFGMVVV